MRGAEILLQVGALADQRLRRGWRLRVIGKRGGVVLVLQRDKSEEHTSELQSH